MSQVMRTVKIPECMNPFYVEVNGHKYSYPAGTTQEVPEEVAVVIEAHEGVHHHGYHGPVHNQSMNIRPDWSVNDPGDLRFVRNRPCYEDTAVLFDQTVEFTTDNELQHIVNGVLPIESGDTVKVTWGGVEYECDAVAVADGEYTLVMIGNVYGEGTEPFVIIVVPPEGITIISSTHMEGEIDVKIEKSVVHKIDPKFLPSGGGGKVVYYWDSVDDTLVDESGNAVTVEQAKNDMLNVVIRDTFNGGVRIPHTIYFGDEYVEFTVDIWGENATILVGEEPK